MNRIRENVRMALSRPWAVWVLLIGGAAVYGLLVLLEAVAIWGWRFGPMPLSWWWTHMLMFGGVAIGGDRHEGLGMPLSFTLPGYRESLRGASFVRAVRWGVVFALLWSSHIWSYRQLLGDWPSDMPKPAFMIGPSAAAVSLNMVGGFLVGMVICLVWVNSQLIWFRRRGFAIVLVGVPIAMAAVGIFHGERYPWVVWPPQISLSVLFCGFFWRRLGDMEWIRSGQREVLVHKIGGPGGTDVGTTVASWMEDLFLGGMRRGGATAAPRYVWGWVYRVFGPIFARWKWIVVWFPMGIPVLGYLGRLYVGMAFVSLGFLVAGHVWSASSTILFPEGRREKYYLTIASGALATLLLIAVSAGIVALSWLFAALLPSIPLGTYHLQYTGFNMRNIWLACLPVPWFPIIMLLFVMLLLSVRLVLPFLILLAVIFFVASRVPDLQIALTLLPVLLPVLLACGWVFFLAVVWIRYRRWDLADESAVGDT